MLVRDIMTSPVLTVSPEERLETVSQLLVRRHISGVFVIDDGEVVGCLSHRDILRRVFPTPDELYEDMVHGVDFEEIQRRARELGPLTVSEVMNRDVLTVTPETHVMKLASLMLLRDRHRVAVVDEAGRLCGVASRGDVFYRTISAELGQPQTT